MKVEVHFKFETNNKRNVVDNAISQANKNLTGFFSSVGDDFGYAFMKISDDIWRLSGDAVFMFKVLSILSEKKDNLSEILAVDTYCDGLSYLSEQQSDEYKFRFVTPYFLKISDKETGKILNDKDGPYLQQMAQDIKGVLEEVDDTGTEADQDDKHKEVLVEIFQGSPGYKVGIKSRPCPE